MDKSLPQNLSMRLRQGFEKRPSFWVVIALAALTLAAFAPAANFELINFDDNHYIEQNDRLKDGLTLGNIGWSFTTRHMSNWHPLTWLVYFTVYEFFGHNVSALHLTNVFFHVLSVLLLFSVLDKTTGSLWKSAFVAAVYAIHPLRAESVAWVSELKDVLGAFFWMLTLFCYARYIQRKKQKRDYFLTLGAFALGLMAKPMLVTLPCVLLLMDFWPLSRMKSRQEFKKLLIEKIPFFVLVFFACLLTVWAQAAKGAMISLDKLPFDMRVANALIVYMKYIRMMIWPVDLAVFYPRMAAETPAWAVLSSAAILLTVTGMAWKYAKRFPYLLMGWLWYAGTLVPIIGIVQVGSQEMADRYTYIPSVGLIIMAAWGISEFAGKKRLMPKALVILGLGTVLILGVMMRHQLSYWQNSIELWSHTAKVTKRNYVAHIQLGHAYFHQDKHEIAEEHLRRGIHIKWNEWRGHNLLGHILANRNDYEEALKHYSYAAQISEEQGMHRHPEFAEIYYNMGVLNYNMRRLDEAEKLLHRALEVNPEYTNANARLAVIYLKRCEVGKALTYAEKALKTDKQHKAALEVIESLNGMGGDDSLEKKIENCETLQTIETLQSISHVQKIRKLPSTRIPRLI